MLLCSVTDARDEPPLMSEKTFWPFIGRQRGRETREAAKKGLERERWPNGTNNQSANQTVHSLY